VERCVGPPAPVAAVDDSTTDVLRTTTTVDDRPRRDTASGMYGLELFHSTVAVVPAGLVVSVSVALRLHVRREERSTDQNRNEFAFHGTSPFLNGPPGPFFWWGRRDSPS
jgi:hypothetical protein